ncbi:hypothetical protein [Nocardia sp. NPDC051570]|uniref:hypothetical protein n=1 Tax=Nocardia sp. NPDC051570 TaxID=3364324 RepID=UPI0037B96F8F
MPRFTFHGRDDELAFVETADDFDRLSETYDAYDGARFHILSSSGELRVIVGDDSGTGCWNISLGPIHCASPVPNWPVTVGAAPEGPGALLTVDAPADARLVEVMA